MPTRSYRTTPVADSQLDEMHRLGYGNISEITTTALDHFYQAEIGPLTPEEKARKRVAADRLLRTYGPIIFADWPNVDDHYKWIAGASTQAIIAWAEEIAAGEQAQAQEERAAEGSPDTGWRRYDELTAGQRAQVERKYDADAVVSDDVQAFRQQYGYWIERGDLTCRRKAWKIEDWNAKTLY